MNTTKYVFTFGGGTAEGDKTMKALLGGKGANLAEMSTIGLPIPPGFTISTEVCQYYNQNNHRWPKGLAEQIDECIVYLEDLMGLTFGDTEKPLLVSVRSGAASSMPGMMDTVLDLGLNDESVKGLARMTCNHRFAYDCYRRFIDMFGDVVMGVPHETFEHVLQQMKTLRGIQEDTDFDLEDLHELVERYKAIYRKETGYMFPQNPREQLNFAINAVFGSWNTKRAQTYRKINRITGLLGTAVNIQSMVYGNMGSNSATGVCFTRNPATGENVLFGEFLINAQGEDVVAGIRTPRNIDELNKLMPSCYAELLVLTNQLERHYQDVQDIEFTIQEGKLYILQTRSGKRTGAAAIKIAVDLVNEGLTSKKEAVKRLVEPRHLEQLLHPQLSTSEIHPNEIIGHGLPASPGAAVGKIVFNAEDAEVAHAQGEHVILVRVETSPEDVGGMSASEGIITSRGGMTSHAAVVARGWGKPCIAGCEDIVVNYDSQTFTSGDKVIKKGDWISMDGTKGLIIVGKKPVVDAVLDDTYYTFMEWVKKYEDMIVRTNADTPTDALQARQFGAKGIGLCRTEHMFFGPERINLIRKMIVAENEIDRRAALDRLLPFQKQDFEGIFKAMDGLPVTIRLLDPPLHEFLPNEPSEIAATAHELGINIKELNREIKALKEFNPMLGHRGCRLGITFPEITEMQTRAILETALELRDQGIAVYPELMVPLVGITSEFTHQHAIIDRVAKDVFKEFGQRIPYQVGTMIEIPRAAIIADQIAEEAEFFSFGTNDLTQMTFGFSRDDSGKFLETYLKQGILREDPFQTLDQEGVGSLVAMAIKRGRKMNKNLKIGICGEHGGDPASVEFFYNKGLNYVSCSPFRVPIARLAVAQARLKSHK